MSSESYPDDLLYHPEHDWARIDGDEAVLGGGEVTSGTMSPSLGVGIGMAFLPPEKAEPGTQIEIDVRGKARPAEVRSKPLYTKET